MKDKYKHMIYGAICALTLDAFVEIGSMAVVDYFLEKERLYHKINITDFEEYKISDLSSKIRDGDSIENIELE